MSFILAGFLGSPAAEDEAAANAASVAQIDQQLTKMTTSALLEDRRDAVQAINRLARSHRLLVGTLCLQALLEELDRDLEDEESTKSVLETLTALCSADSEDATNSGVDVQFCEILLKEPANVALLLRILDDKGTDDFYLKYTVIQLLRALCSALPAQLQAAVLASPSGCSQVLNLLQDQREVIRNEGLVLTRLLVAGNADLQKIIAFQGAFEIGMKVAVEGDGGSVSVSASAVSACWEGSSAGSAAVIQDALELLRALLLFNTANQNYFRDSVCFKQLAGLLAYGNGPSSLPSKDEWSRTQCGNYVALLQVIAVLLNEANVDLETGQLQALQTNYLRPLLLLAFDPNVPVAVSSLALQCLGALIHGNAVTQTAAMKERLAFVAAPPGIQIVLPCSPILAAVLTAVHGSSVSAESHLQRVKALDLVGSYCFRNADGQLAILSTVNAPPSENLNSTNSKAAASIGTLLLSALLDIETMRRGKDVWRGWFAASLLATLLDGNDECKAAALRFQVPEELSEDYAGESLLSALMLSLLKLSRDSHTPAHQRYTLGILSLLIVWLNESPASVAVFISEGSFIQFLVERITTQVISTSDGPIQGLAAFLLGFLVLFNDDQQPSMTSETVKTIVKNRIGPDLYLCRLSRLKDVLIGDRAHEDTETPFAIPSSVASLFHRLSDQLTVAVAKPTPSGHKASTSATLAQLRTDLAATRALLADSQTSAVSANHVASTLRIGIAERDAYIVQLQRMIAEKNQRLAQMAQELSRQQQMPPQVYTSNSQPLDTEPSHAQASCSLDEKNKLMEQCAQYHEQYVADQAAIQQLNETISAFQTTVDHQQTRIQELERQLGLLQEREGSSVPASAEASSPLANQEQLAELEMWKQAYNELYTQMQQQLHGLLDDASVGESELAENVTVEAVDAPHPLEAKAAVEDPTADDVRDEGEDGNYSPSQFMSPLAEPISGAVLVAEGEGEELFASADTGDTVRFVANLNTVPAFHGSPRQYPELSKDDFEQPLLRRASIMAVSSTSAGDTSIESETPPSAFFAEEQVSEESSRDRSSGLVPSALSESFEVISQEIASLSLPADSRSSASVSPPNEVQEVLDFFDKLPDVPTSRPSADVAAVNEAPLVSELESFEWGQQDGMKQDEQNGLDEAPPAIGQEHEVVVEESSYEEPFVAAEPQAAFAVEEPVTEELQQEEPVEAHTPSEVPEDVNEALVDASTQPEQEQAVEQYYYGYDEASGMYYYYDSATQQYYYYEQTAEQNGADPAADASAADQSQAWTFDQSQAQPQEQSYAHGDYQGQNQEQVYNQEQNQEQVYDQGQNQEHMSSQGENQEQMYNQGQSQEQVYDQGQQAYGGSYQYHAWDAAATASYPVVGYTATYNEGLINQSTHETASNATTESAAPTHNSSNPSLFNPHGPPRIPLQQSSLAASALGNPSYPPAAAAPAPPSPTLTSSKYMQPSQTYCL